MPSRGEFRKWRGLLVIPVSWLLSACGGLTTSCAPPDPIDPALMMPCQPTVFAADVGWMQAHELNTISAEHCRLQYEALVRVVKARQKE